MSSKFFQVFLKMNYQSESGFPKTVFLWGKECVYDIITDQSSTRLIVYC